MKALFDFGAGDMMEITQPVGGSIFLPFTREAVPEIDLDAGRIVVDPPQEVEATAEDGTPEDSTGTKGGAA